ncbi:MAG: SPOR domain-containing protein [Deltaproteobacteria bacterium]
MSRETTKETLPPPAPASPVARPAPETPKEIPPPPVETKRPSVSPPPPAQPTPQSASTPVETKRPSVSPPPPAQPTPQSASTPAKTKDTAVGTYFTLQIASFKDRAQAEHAAQNWADKGYRARATGVDLGAKGTWYRVYIGRFETLDEAKAFERIISKKEGIKAYIVSVKD